MVMKEVAGGPNAKAKAKAKPPSSVKIFVYGTLKQGFPNHPLLQDMMATGDASFLGSCRTVQRLPLICGPYRVPFLLNFPGRGQRVFGELYAVSAAALAKIDELEGVVKGHYERLAVEVEVALEGEEEAAAAEAYYGHRSYAEALWRRSGEEGYDCYTEGVAGGYVRRKDRPHHLTFLDHIHHYVSSSSDSSTVPNSD
ncbi:putative gamma-glutamylcyclotransferase At3g02910 [Andrographis paniculata]|uniref:putative gamma-glutamylcyclotransferase At3g02910 n=1 Tax=Andrographis paniculata TaxID=175694 RepID=UPI0021E8ABFC|nr:putative gamma-glutamylcyclotransferase At3g02910 [Andrographis paniculata]XP_051138963.1 putative gamma-glutamylcyclotransferase At3g02910 [Andrographis paniculata]XP_051138964.1 putative gamma-glutamylcyclotransferase At3g02910 [Andrographis paniculata]